MKAYTIRLEFVDLKPVVWRQLVLPYGATFRRLHETIQWVTNFRSVMGIDRHLYVFDLPHDHLYVTNASEIDQHPGLFTAAWQVRNPARIKMDSFLERYGQLHYTYDFGDNWSLLIHLERIVDDYHFGYPTLIAGDGEAPPEDIGGPEGFALFLSRFFNQSHPGYSMARVWAQENHFRLYDQNWLNHCLKSIKWQKTEWDQIEHANYRVIRDPYRGSDPEPGQ